jgi:hypothetical protein
MNFAANTDVMREAAGLLVEAHQYFNDKLTGLQQTVADAADQPFVGGYGQTGAYQAQLSDFNKRFLEVFQEFVEDETLFVKFLGQLHARLTQTANLYDSTEEQNTQRLTAITKQLDGQGS